MAKLFEHNTPEDQIVIEAIGTERYQRMRAIVARMDAGAPKREDLAELTKLIESMTIEQRELVRVAVKFALAMRRVR